MRVVRDGAKRLYQQIYAQLRAQIFSGEIAAGQPLPSYRFMSRKYQVNVATVEKAYDLLEANGYIRRCQGSGRSLAIVRRRKGLRYLSDMTNCRCRLMVRIISCLVADGSVATSSSITRR